MISALIPIVGPFISLLSPLPFLYFATKLGITQGIKLAAITVLLAGVIGNLGGFPQVIFLSIEFSLLGLIISEIFRREYSFGFSILWGTILMLIVGLVILIVIGLTRGMGPFELILDYFQSNMRETLTSYEKLGLDPDKTTQFQEYADTFVKVITSIYPALMVIGTGFVVWINILISRPLFRVGKLKYPDFGPMDHWSAPDYLVWGVIGAGFSLFLPVTGIKLLAINGLMVMLVIYIFHGFSILLFYVNKYRVPTWLRVGIYLLVVFQQIFLVLLALVGLFDQWIRFRRIPKNIS